MFEQCRCSPWMSTHVLGESHNAVDCTWDGCAVTMHMVIAPVPQNVVLKDFRQVQMLVFLLKSAGFVG